MVLQSARIMKRSKFIDDLCKLVSIQSCSYETGQMMKHISSVVQSIQGCTTSTDSYGNLYVTKGYGPYKTMVCHTDTVHDIVKAKVIPMKIKGNIIAINSKKISQIGTGGDDKCGIAITLQLLKDEPNMKAVFFLDEEVGCLGSSKLDVDFFNDCLFVLQCDRRGSNDFVNKISGTKLYDDNFSQAIKYLLDKYSRVEVGGGMTDVLEIAYVTDLPVANMSCGYYNPHTDQEYINIEDFIDTYRLCSDIFKYINDKHTVKTKRESYSYGMIGRYSGYDWDYNYNSHYHLAYDEKELAEAEAKIKKLCGSGCGMYDGYCDACMTTAEDAMEYYLIEDKKDNNDKLYTQLPAMDKPLQNRGSDKTLDDDEIIRV